MDRWKHRRRLVYTSVILSALMIVFGGVTFWRDAQVSSELVRSGTAILTLILSGYVFAATLDDKWHDGGNEDE